VPLSSIGDTDWQIVAVGDFDGSGQNDIVWRHRVTGRNAIWFIRNAILERSLELPAVLDPGWEITGATTLSVVEGLYRFSLSAERQFKAHDLVVRSEDLELRLPDGFVFVAETGGRISAAVLVGRGEMIFRPSPDGTMYPVSFSITTSLAPPTSVTTTGLPAAIYSRIEFENPSAFEERTQTSATLSSSAMFSQRPRKNVRSSIPNSVASSRNDC